MRRPSRRATVRSPMVTRDSPTLAFVDQDGNISFEGYNGDELVELVTMDDFKAQRALLQATVLRLDALERRLP